MTSYPYVYASELIEDCIERIRDYSEDSIPVLDENNRLTGVLTAQDIVQLVNDLLGEDYAKLAGLSSGEDLQEPLKKSIGKRLPWLVILLGLGMVVPGPGVKFCVNVFRQSQEWRWKAGRILA